MPKPRKKKLTAWSFSRWSQYERCPLQTKLAHIERLPQPEKGPAAQRGIDTHKTAELFVGGEIDELPEVLETFEEEFIELVDLTNDDDVKVLAEQQLAFNVDWDPTGWFDSDTWVRMITDCTVVHTEEQFARVIDYKTGKKYPEHELQLGLFGLGVLRSEDVGEVQVELWYLDQGEEEVAHYTEDDIPRLQTEWEKRSKRMMTDTRFDPNPGHYCRWCPWSKEKGGPCKY